MADEKYVKYFGIVIIDVFIILLTLHNTQVIRESGEERLSVSSILATTCIIMSTLALYIFEICLRVPNEWLTIEVQTKLKQIRKFISCIHTAAMFEFFFCCGIYGVLHLDPTVETGDFTSDECLNTVLMVSWVTSGVVGVVRGTSEYFQMKRNDCDVMTV